MSHSRTIADLEADLAALRASAERAGTALACLFSSSDEFEAAVVRVRREQGAFRVRGRGWHRWRAAAAIAVLAVVLMLI